ncbi:alpha/beta hydrolase, partial [Thioclava sp. BHET1]
MAEVLVFIPGLGCDARAIWYQLVALSGDMPVMVAAPVAGESVEEMAEALLPSLPERMALLGQGLGGNVALEIQMRAPERVARIALIGVSV